MKKAALIFTIIVAILAVGYYVTRYDIVMVHDVVMKPPAQYTSFSSTELGLGFRYRTGSTGYVLEKVPSVDTAAGQMDGLMLIKTKDKSEGVLEASEGPATMFVLVFTNTKKQQSRAWADTHTQYSNINLKVGDVTDLQVGVGHILENPNAIRYMVDGLYRTDTIVAAHGEYIYVIGGSYLDEDSELRRDFKPFVDSIVFAPQPAQK